MNKKIKNNQTYNDLRKQLEILNNVKSLDLINKETLENIPEMEKQLNELSSIPDDFNHYFSSLGWIAHKSMNFELMKKAVELAQKDKIKEAEIELIKYYKSDKIKFFINRLSGIKEFRERDFFLDLAYEDFLSERYYSCVLILLTIIDGVVDSISNKSFFVEENKEILIDNSIAGHKTGLETISKLYSAYRKKATSEKITIPYRNGIIHGKDLGYNNEYVASKCWATIFAIGDWCKAYKNKKESEKTSKTTNKEELIDLHESLNQLEKLKQQNLINSQRIEEWQARSLIINQDLPETGKPEDYKNGTPEKELAIFFENWTKKNYGNIADQLWEYHDKPDAKNYKAGKLNKLFKSKEFVNFKIKNIEDCSPSITEIETDLTIKEKNIEHYKTHKFRLLYLNEEGCNLFREIPEGNWKLVYNFASL